MAEVSKPDIEKMAAMVAEEITSNYFSSDYIVRSMEEAIVDFGRKCYEAGFDHAVEILKAVQR